jgi:hypothetical protein
MSDRRHEPLSDTYRSPPACGAAAVPALEPLISLARLLARQAAREQLGNAAPGGTDRLRGANSGAESGLPRNPA